MASGIIIALNATVTADDDGICQAQTAKTLTINGSLTSGGAYSAGTNWGQKVKITSAADESGKTFDLTGVFFASDTVSDYTTTMSLTGPNASSVTSSLYAASISAIVASTITASSITVGTVADGASLPQITKLGSLYQGVYGGTFGGASLEAQRYQADMAQWVALDSAQTAAAVRNYELPAGTSVRLVPSSMSTTSQVSVVLEPINKSS